MIDDVTIGSFWTSDINPDDQSLKTALTGLFNEENTTKINASKQVTPTKDSTDDISAEEIDTAGTEAVEAVLRETRNSVKSSVGCGTQDACRAELILLDMSQPQS